VVKSAATNPTRRHKTIAEISEEFEKARAKDARKRMEATLNFRGAYGGGCTVELC
jgi:hypothetical protein